MCLRRKESSKGKCMPSTKRGHSSGHTVEITRLVCSFPPGALEAITNHKGMDLTAKMHIRVNKVWFEKKPKQEESKKRTVLLWLKLSLKSKLGDLRNICEKNSKHLLAWPLAAHALPITEEGVDITFKQTHHRSISGPQPPSTAGRFAPQLHYSLWSLLCVFCIHNGIFHLRIYKASSTLI